MIHLIGSVASSEWQIAGKAIPNVVALLRKLATATCIVGGSDGLDVRLIEEGGFIQREAHLGLGEEKETYGTQNDMIHVHCTVRFNKVEGVEKWVNTFCGERHASWRVRHHLSWFMYTAMDEGDDVGNAVEGGSGEGEEQEEQQWSLEWVFATTNEGFWQSSQYLGEQSDLTSLLALTDECGVVASTFTFVGDISRHSMVVIEEWRNLPATSVHVYSVSTHDIVSGGHIATAERALEMKRSTERNTEAVAAASAAARQPQQPQHTRDVDDALYPISEEEEETLQDLFPRTVNDDESASIFAPRESWGSIELKFELTPAPMSWLLIEVVAAENVRLPMHTERLFQGERSGRDTGVAVQASVSVSSKHVAGHIVHRTLTGRAPCIVVAPKGRAVAVPKVRAQWRNQKFAFRMRNIEVRAWVVCRFMCGDASFSGLFPHHPFLLPTYSTHSFSSLLPPSPLLSPSATSTWSFALAIQTP